MIRIGNIKDIEQGIVLLKENVKEFDFGQFDDDNTEYYRGLMEAIAKDRTAVVSENDGIIDGVLLGMRIPNLLNPKNVQFHILLTWVHKDKRGSSIFYRMNKYLEKEVLKNEEVIFYNIPETNINFNKLGYRKFQSMHMKKVI